MTSVPDLFNQEAAESDPAGIHKYSDDLAHLLVPEKVGDSYIYSFAVRLARAERAARDGKGKLIAEAEVARAFNELMRQIGASPSIKADISALHKFRVHAAVVGALSGVLTEDRNGANCYPGEAVYLLWVLLATDGTIPEHYLEGVEALSGQVGWGDKSASVVQSSELKMKAASFLIAYSVNHPRRETTKLFNRLAKNLDL